MIWSTSTFRFSVLYIVEGPNNYCYMRFYGMCYPRLQVSIPSSTPLHVGMLCHPRAIPTMGVLSLVGAYYLTTRYVFVRVVCFRVLLTFVLYNLVMSRLTCPCLLEDALGDMSGSKICPCDMLSALSMICFNQLYSHNYNIPSFELMLLPNHCILPGSYCPNQLVWFLRD